MQLRFVHTADLHLGSPFKGLEKVSPQVAAELRNSTFRTFENIIDLCIAEQADALFIAGDIFDSADRSLQAQIAFHKGLFRLDHAGIASFICHGNHDPLDGWEAKLALPPSCHQFGPDIAEVPVDAEGKDRVVVVGVSYPTRDIRANLALGFRRPAGAEFVIGLLHCNAAEDPGHGAYSPCSLEDLVGTGIDYWALGHIHNRKVLTDSRPWIVYPGTPQGRQPKESGARGVYVVSVNDGGVGMEFRPVDVIRWEAIELDIQSLTSEQELIDRIVNAAKERLDSSEGRSLVFTLSLTGTTPLHDTLRRPNFTTELVDEVNGRFANTNPWAWCGKTSISTKAPFNRAERRQAQDFLGVLLRFIDDVKSNDGLRSDIRAELNLLYDDERLRGYLQLSDLGSQDLDALIDEAEAICVEHLVEPEQ